MKTNSPGFSIYFEFDDPDFERLSLRRNQLLDDGLDHLRIFWIVRTYDHAEGASDGRQSLADVVRDLAVSKALFKTYSALAQFTSLDRSSRSLLTRNA